MSDVDMGSVRNREIEKLGVRPGQNLREILEAPIRSLAKPIVGSSVEPLIERVHRDLEARGLDFRPHYWVSWEWFCPDGVPGVAIPFNVLDPQILAFERKFVGRVDGDGPEACLKILRHEIAHAIDNAYRLRRHPLRQQLFGSSHSPYPRFYVPRLYSTKHVAHLGEGYGQSHPDEDFAETLAVWLTPGSRWRERYKGTGALIKLQAVDTMMKEIRGKRPLLNNKRRVDPIEQCKWTFAQYIRWRQKQQGWPNFKELDQVLIKMGRSANNRNAKVARLIRKSREFAIRDFSNATGWPHYRADMFLRRVAQRAAILNLSISESRTPSLKRFSEELVRRVTPIANEKTIRIYL